MLRTVLSSASLVIGAIVAGPAMADSYPSKPIKIIVPFPAGGPSDVIARALGEKAGAKLGQIVIVENKPGANQIVGATAVMNAAPDGYTLFWSSLTLTSLNPYLYKKLPYDETSFVPVSLLFKTNEFLIVNAQLGVNNLREFIALAKAKPGAINYASFGNGTLGHLQGIALEQASGIKLNHVPYKGMAQVVPDLMANRVQIVFTSVWSVMSQIEAGKVKPLALSASERSVNLPGVPTFRESGIEMAYGAWLGLFARKGTPEAIVRKIAAEFAAAARDPELRAKYTDRQDLPAVGSTPAEFAEFLKKDRAFWGPLVKASGVTLD